jgi:ADP-ribose pyrophosphatase
MAESFRPVYEAAGNLPVRLEVADVEHPPGNHYLHHRLVVADGRPGVVIAAGDGTSVLLVRSRRASVDAELWELPRGSSDLDDGKSADENSDEALIRAGLRELHEETGYRGHAARIIGRYVTDSTVFPQRVAVVQCTVERNATPQPTDGEVEEARWFTIDTLRHMVVNAEIRDAHTLAAYAFLAARSHS